MDMSPSKPATISVRRSSPCLATISASSPETTSRWRCGLSRISVYAAIRAMSSSYSSWIFWDSSAASWRSCICRMDCAWTSSMSRSSLSASRATSAEAERRMVAMTSSSMSSALSRPRRMWARSSALRLRNAVRRTITSIWCFTQWCTKPSSERVRGTPSTSASMFAEKLDCSSVCL